MAHEFPDKVSSAELRAHADRAISKAILIKLVVKPKEFYSDFVGQLRKERELGRLRSAETLLNEVLNEISNLDQFKIVYNNLLDYKYYEQLKELDLLDKLPVMLNAHREAILSKLEINPISNRNPIQPPILGNSIRPEPQILESSKPSQPSTPQTSIPNITPNTIALPITGINGSLDSISIPPSGPTTPGALYS